MDLASSGEAPGGCRRLQTPLVRVCPWPSDSVTSAVVLGIQQLPVVEKWSVLLAVCGGLGGHTSRFHDGVVWPGVSSRSHAAWMVAMGGLM
jgi:hypothetical protein